MTPAQEIIADAGEVIRLGQEILAELRPIYEPDTQALVPADLVEAEIDKIATQYREAERLKGYMRGVLSEVTEAASAIWDIPNHFDLMTARGEQLTFIGKRMGFGRCHCVCTMAPVFGFACDDSAPMQPVVGFCEGGTWADCGEDGDGQLCISDDEVYRAHLLARRYQMLGLFDVESLTTAMRTVWGPKAWIVDSHRGRIVLSPGRALDAEELRRCVLTLRILPIAPGIDVWMRLRTTPIFGFGDGWHGFCETPAAEWMCPVKIDPYACN